MFIKTKSLLTKQDSFLRNVAVLSSASVVAQAINVLSMPLFSRLYSPSDFGTLVLFSSVVGLFSTISGFRYNLVIPLARTERYLQSLLWLSLIFQCICVVFFALIIEYASRFLVGTSYAVLIPYRFLMPFAVLCIGIYSLLKQWAIRAKEFPLIAKTKLTQTISRAVVIMFCGLLGFRPIGLLLGNILGESFGSSTLFRALLRRSNKILFSWTHIKRVGIFYRKMFFFETPSALINMSGLHLLPIVMAFYFAPDVVGSFSMSRQVLALPSVLIGTAIGQVFIQRASEAKAQGNVANIMLKAMLMLIRTGIFPILAIGILAPSIFVPVLGSKWAEAGKFTQILSPWIALNFIYSPLSMIFIIMMMQKIAFAFVSIYTLLRLLSLYIGRNDPILALSLLSFVGSICMILGVIIPAYFVKIDMKMMFFQTAKALIEVLIELSPIVLMAIYFKNSMPLSLSILSFIVGGIIYVCFLWKYLK